jgi:hypothetical protein
MSNKRVERIRHVVANWGDPVFDEARRLEGKLAAAAADAMVDAMIDLDDMPEVLAHAELSDAEEELRAVHTLEKEVMEGGYQQYLDSCGLLECELAAQGFARIGAPVFEKITRAALALVPDVPEEDDWPEPLETALGELDERFYDGYTEVEGLLLLRLKYAAEHPDEFRALRD